MGKGKVRDKLNNLVLFDAATQEKFLKEVPSYKLITPAVVSERLKIRGSLARKALIDLHKKGLVRQVVKHSSQVIYTRNTNKDPIKRVFKGRLLSTVLHGYLSLRRL